MSIPTLDGKRVTNVVLWAVVAVLAINVVRQVRKGTWPISVRAAASPTYTVIRTEKAFDKTGNLLYTNEYLDAARSDGAVVLRTTTSLSRERRIGFPSGAGVVTNDLIARKSTYPKKFLRSCGASRSKRILFERLRCESRNNA
jgi:hypothetical protein